MILKFQSEISVEPDYLFTFQTYNFKRQMLRGFREKHVYLIFTENRKSNF